jgi:hypothetical protein
MQGMKGANGRKEIQAAGNKQQATGSRQASHEEQVMEGDKEHGAKGRKEIQAAGNKQQATSRQAMRNKLRKDEDVRREKD